MQASRLHDGKSRGHPMSWYRWFPPSKPRKAAGGIKAQSKRGSFGSSWWGKRWVEVLESFDIGARLNRGRTYARGGQVLGIDVAKGEIKAKVQGSRPQPYKVRIRLKPLSKDDWEHLTKALGARAVYAAKLLAGEMPQEIEDVFRDVGLPLFPQRYSDLNTECSCPDYSNPCKHIAAVYYLLAEEFDRDPFVLFKLRGLERDELIAGLGSVSAVAEEAPPAPPEPLPADVASYWQGGPAPADVSGPAEYPRAAASLPRRLGAFPFWRGEKPLTEALTPIYERATPHGLDVLLGQRPQES
jgi:uncharacterized Zn finger protein